MQARRLASSYMSDSLGLRAWPPDLCSALCASLISRQKLFFSLDTIAALPLLDLPGKRLMALEARNVTDRPLYTSKRNYPDSGACVCAPALAHTDDSNNNDKTY